MSEPKTSQLPWQGLLALAAAVAGAVLYLAPLDTSRPLERGGVSLKLNREQDVDARLWQDPLAVAFAHEEKVRAIDETKDPVNADREESFHSAYALCKQIDDAGRNGGRLIVMPVLVSGGSYAEYGENRLRARRAVLEALGTNQFSPKDGEHIGYVRMRPLGSKEVGAQSICQGPKPERDQSALDEHFILPYEWCGAAFRSDSESSEARVLLLWVREEELDSRPLAGLASLLRLLNIDPKIVRVIGPRTSTALRLMVDEVTSVNYKSPDLNGAVMFSPTASMSEELLLLGNKGGAGTVKDLLREKVNGLTFHRITSTDATVCRALITELGRRGVKLNFRDHPPDYTVGNDHVALISEWDTSYGRSLPLSFKREASLGRDWEKLLQEYPDNIHPFHYLRGIDGLLPGASTQDQATKSSKKDDTNNRPREEMEGLNQADYLRRLAAQLLEKHRSLIQEGGPGLKAVGVLGSDVYDKLLVLKALRRSLPGVLFFTNNLDARFGHPDEWNWARNLIVASPFDLRLAVRWRDDKTSFDLQGKIPPFRDSYQTATYAAALLASDGQAATVLEHWPAPLGEPRLFEIARSGPYPLPAATADSGATLHPDRHTEWWNRKRFWQAVAITLFLLVLISWVKLVLTQKPRHTPIVPSLAAPAELDPVIQESARAKTGIFAFFVLRPITWLAKLLGRRQEDDANQKAQYAEVNLCAPEHRVEKPSFFSSWAIFGLAGLGAWVVVAFIARWQLSGGEPFSWGDGISIWPTQVIRLVAFGMAIVFFCKTHHALKQNEGEIEEVFCLKSDRKRKRNTGKCFSQAWWDDRIARLTLLYWRVQDRASREISAKALWREYIKAGVFRHRVQRIALPLFCYLVAATFLVFLLGEPHVPYRGDVSYWADRAILFITVFISTALTFYVADATILNRRLIHYLTVADTHWPAETFSECRRRRKLELPRTKQVHPPGGDEDQLPPSELLRDYLDIELVAKRTDIVSGLIYYPFFVLFLMIISRMGLFDNWEWPLSLILVLLFNGSYAAWSAFRLRNTAERARTAALQRLTDLLVRYTAAGRDFERHVNTIRETIAAIRAEHRGAFASITRHPILGAILLPSGGLGIWALTQYLPNFFQ